MGVILGLGLVRVNDKPTSGLVLVPAAAAAPASAQAGMAMAHWYECCAQWTAAGACALRL